MPQFPELRGSISNIIYPAWADIKLDGEGIYMVKLSESKMMSQNRYGHTQECPKERWTPSMKMHKTFTLLGEMYSGNGERGALYDLLKHPNKLNDYAVFFSPFDILELDGVDLVKEPLISRKEILLNKGFDNFIEQHMSKVVNNKAEAQAFFKEATSKDWEGVVLKNLNDPFITGPCAWAKMKYKDTNNFIVVYIDQVKERIEVEVPLPQGVSGNRKCGVKCMNKDRHKLKVGDIVKIEHQGILSGGGLRHPVFKGLA